MRQKQAIIFKILKFGRKNYENEKSNSRHSSRRVNDFSDGHKRVCGERDT